MKQLKGISYNLLNSYPTGFSKKAQAELVIHLAQITYVVDAADSQVLKRHETIKSIRFITESEQLKDLAMQLIALAEVLDTLQEEGSVKLDPSV